MTENYIETTKDGGQMFVGPKAVDLYRAAALRSSLLMLGKGIKMRGLTLTRALSLATEYTGNKYKRTEAEKARADLQIVLDKQKQEIEIRRT